MPGKTACKTADCPRTLAGQIVATAIVAIEVIVVIEAIGVTAAIAESEGTAVTAVTGTVTAIGSEETVNAKSGTTATEIVIALIAHMAMEAKHALPLLVRRFVVSCTQVAIARLRLSGSRESVSLLLIGTCAGAARQKSKFES